jgi:hypothetical protein
MAPRWILVACLLASGCTRHWSAHVEQPPLLLNAGVAMRTSMPLAIVVRDMESGRYPIVNRAYYVIVSRDRLRFHITLHHKWDEVADLKNWTAYVEDAHGKRHYPADLTAGVERVTTVQINGARYLMNILMYRGTADLSIYDHDLLAAGNQLTLVLTRPGVEYRYRWVTAELEQET